MFTWIGKQVKAAQVKFKEENARIEEENKLVETQFENDHWSTIVRCRRNEIIVLFKNGNPVIFSAYNSFELGSIIVYDNEAFNLERNYGTGYLVRSSGLSTQRITLEIKEDLTKGSSSPVGTVTITKK
jgi:hypothetical protein